ncbi:MAG TPA: hypothetical protein P5138_06615, partial [Solirubrobacterales bacterium]|nr:hypothetical protein [Solirubrobacterales bacterium]
ARLVRDVSAADELPARLAREREGLPRSAVIWLALLGAAFSMLPGITSIVSFGSLTFLVVFGLINLMHARHTAKPGWDRTVAYLAGAACFAASTGLIYYLARYDRAGLALIAVCALSVMIARTVFLRSKQATVRE